MAPKLVSLLLLFSQLVAIAFALPAEVPAELEARQSISTLSTTEVSSYKPYTWYAFAAYCNPANTLTWKCGVRCSSNPSFIPIASGGDGILVQYWYVGYDPTLESVIVAYQASRLSRN
ncbi:hypothetical protein MD484_g5424, partial [Candolleomyces efflorescens]